MFEDDKRVYNEITISTAEYMELARKALKFDMLKKHTEKSSFLTDFERAVFEVDDKEAAENVDA